MTERLEALAEMAKDLASDSEPWNLVGMDDGAETDWAASVHSLSSNNSDSGPEAEALADTSDDHEQKEEQDPGPEDASPTAAKTTEEDIHDRLWALYKERWSTIITDRTATTLQRIGCSERWEVSEAEAIEMLSTHSSWKSFMQRWDEEMDSRREAFYTAGKNSFLEYSEDVDWTADINNADESVTNLTVKWAPALTTCLGSEPVGDYVKEEIKIVWPTKEA
jgi:hypothetical protein